MRQLPASSCQDPPERSSSQLESACALLLQEQADSGRHLSHLLETRSGMAGVYPPFSHSSNGCSLLSLGYSLLWHGLRAVFPGAHPVGL
jgi:hypothetical protein